MAAPVKNGSDAVKLGSWSFSTGQGDNPPYPVIVIYWSYGGSDTGGTIGFEYSAPPFGTYETFYEFTVYWIGTGQIALGCTPPDWVNDWEQITYYWSMRPDNGCQVYVMTPSGEFITVISTDETFTLIDQGNNTFALQASNGSYVTADSSWDRSDDNEASDSITVADQNGTQYTTIGAAQQFTIVRFTSSDPVPLNSIILISGSARGWFLGGFDLSIGGILASVAGIDFTGATLDGAWFTGLTDFTLSGTNFTNASMVQVNFGAMTDLRDAVWTGANLSKTDFTPVADEGTDLTGLKFDGMNFSGAAFGPRSGSPFDFSGASFEGANLSGTNLTGVRFAGAHLENANLQGATVDQADFTNAYLGGADFTGATIGAANFTGAHMEGTQFVDVDLTSATFDSAPLIGHDSSGATSFAGSTLDYSVLGNDWSYLDLTGSTINNIPKTIENFNAEGAQFPLNIDFSQTVMQNANLANAQMFGALFSKSNLAGAVLDGALAQGARFDGANLAGASIQGTYLIAKDYDPQDPTTFVSGSMAGAFLINAVMDGAHCDGVDFSYCSFFWDQSTSVNPPSAKANATFNLTNFSNANVAGAVFDTTQFAGCDFSGAIMVNASFVACDMSKFTGNPDNPTSMTGADLRGTAFGQSTDNGVNVTNPALMWDVDMKGATVSDSTGGTYSAQLSDFNGNPVDLSLTYGATILGTTDETTTCPNALHGPCEIP